MIKRKYIPLTREPWPNGITLEWYRSVKTGRWTWHFSALSNDGCSAYWGHNIFHAIKHHRSPCGCES